MKYYLVDLERTTFGKVHYWKPNAGGYTMDIKEAGLYTTEEVLMYCMSDIDMTTAFMPVGESEVL